MKETSTIAINCTFCGTENKVRSEYIPGLQACKSCGDVLYELDDTHRNIRVTRRFRELYQILIPQIGEIRKILLQFDRESGLSNCDDDVRMDVIEINKIIPQKNILGVGEIINKLLNENKISDEDTRRSMEDFFALLRKYIDLADHFSTQFDGSKKAMELKTNFRDLRSLEKEVNAFVRMMTVYLGETSVIL